MTLSPAFFTELILGYRRAKAVFAAVELGIFEALHRRPSTAEALAARLHLDGRCLGVLCEALAAMGLLARDNDVFRLGDGAADFLVEGAATYAGSNLRFQNAVFQGWAELETIVARGKPWRGLDELLGDEAFMRSYVLGMLPVARGQAQAVARALAARPYARVLDVGCGPGAYAIALKAACPSAELVLFDLPDTLAVAEEVLVRALAGGYTLRPGDYLVDDFGDEDFDLVLMSHVTHDEGAADTGQLFAKAFAALRPGGRLAVHDWTLDSEWAALFALHLMTYTHRGQVYRLEAYRDLMIAAGFVDVTHQRLGDAAARAATTLIVATKPER